MGMSNYLTEPTLDAVFPATLTVGGSTFTLQNTESMTDGTNLVFQHGHFTNGTDWVVRICKPDNPAAPTAYLYDEISNVDVADQSSLEWLMSSVVTVSTLWNE
jgi:hypothetical protein